MTCCVYTQGSFSSGMNNYLLMCTLPEQGTNFSDALPHGSSGSWQQTVDSFSEPVAALDACSRRCGCLFCFPRKDGADDGCTAPQRRMALCEHGMDATLKLCMKVMGQAPYRASKKIRDEAPFGDAVAWRRLLTVRGRTGAVLLMQPIQNESSNRSCKPSKTTSRMNN